MNPIVSRAPGGRPGLFASLLVLPLIFVGARCADRDALHPPTAALGSSPRAVASAAPSAAPSAKAPAGPPPFRVAFASPKGEVADAPEVTLVFSKPMHPLELVGHETPAPVKITPNIPGEWHWVGSSALRFSPTEKHLPFATEYRVEVPGGTRSLEGDAFADAFAFEFATPAPELVELEPTSDEDAPEWMREDPSDLWLPEAPAWKLHFNQPMALGDVAKALHVTVSSEVPATGAGHRESAPVAVQVTQPEPANAKLFLVRPKGKISLVSTVRLGLDPTLKGAEGPRTLTQTVSKTYHTRGLFEVLGPRCSHWLGRSPKCVPHSDVRVKFTTPVNVKEALSRISISPHVTLPPAADAKATAREVSLGSAFRAGKTYEVTVQGSLRDHFGGRLGAPSVESFEVDDEWPSVDVGAAGVVLDPAAARDIPITSTNVATYARIATPLDEHALAAVNWGATGWGASARLFDQVGKLPGVTVEEITSMVPTNAPDVRRVSLSKLLAKAGGRGTFAVGTRYEGAVETEPVASLHVMQVTDLGITAKLSRFGSIVWVTSLSSGASVPGAEVRIRSRDASAKDLVATTDASGIASFGADAIQFFSAASRGWAEDENAHGSIILVRKENDWAWRSAGALEPSYRLGVRTDYAGALSPVAFVFTERGIYRPGDTVRAKAIVRQEQVAGLSTPKGIVSHVVVKGPTDNVVFDGLPTLSEFGTWMVNIALPGTSPLGTYTIHVMAPDTSGSPDSAYGRQSFEVAEYKPAEFKVRVEAGERALTSGETAHWTSRADYLFGAPMAGASFRSTVTRAPLAWSPPGLPGWTVSDSAFRSGQTGGARGSAVLEKKEGVLGATGVFEFRTQLALSGQSGPETVSCETEVTDLSHQTVSSATSVVVHPGELYPALHYAGESSFFEVANDVAPSVLAVDPSGAKHEGAEVTLSLLRRSWVTAAEKEANGYDYKSKMIDTEVSSCTLTSSNTETSCPLKPATGGLYIVRAKTTDGHRRTTFSSREIYVFGGNDWGWPDSNGSRVDLTTDKSSYVVGDLAKVLIKSPWKEAEALVTVERAGIYTRRQMHVQGGAVTFDVPITEELRPNAFVSVVLVRGRTAPPPPSTAPATATTSEDGPPDLGAPEFRAGYATLSISPESKRLHVNVVPNADEYRPGAKAEVDVSVVDSNGASEVAELAVYAVDEGALMLTGYQTPDPIPVLLRERPLNVALSDSRASMGRVFAKRTSGGPEGSDKGDEGGGGGQGGVRTNFSQTAFFDPAVQTDKAGHAHVSFTLPDTLTSYRVIVVAAGKEDHFGYGAAAITVNQPLVMRPAIARVLRAGDEMRGGVVMTSRGRTPATFRVTATSTQVTQSGSAMQEISLEPGESKAVNFTYRAGMPGEATFRFSAEGGGGRDALEVKRRVLLPGALETVALYGETDGTSREKMGDLSAMRTDVGGLDVSVASSALVGLSGSVAAILEYPYLCTEQLTSRLLVVSPPVTELMRDYGIPLPKDSSAQASQYVDKILRRQQANGGFVWWDWDASWQTSTWLTAYATRGLYLAKKGGATVPDEAFTNACAYLERGIGWVNPYSADLSATVVDALAEVGHPSAAGMNALFERRSWLSVSAKAQLLHAFALAHGDKSAIDTLVTELESHVRLDGERASIVENEGDAYAALLDSSARTTALVLRAFAAAAPHHVLLAPVARALLAVRKEGAWRTTQEDAYALTALDEFRRAHESDAADFQAKVTLGDRLLLSQGMQGRTLNVFSEKVSAEVAFASKGAPLLFEMGGNKKGRLYYEARLSYLPRELPTTPVERGLFVGKTMRVVTPATLSAAVENGTPDTKSVASVRVGDLVLVDLWVVSPTPRSQAVLDDPLPAGLEAVDSSLATSSKDLNVATSGGEADAPEESDSEESARDEVASGKAVLWTNSRKEIRDDRVVYYLEHTAAGLYHFRYLARATTTGEFVMPPTTVAEMYQPEVFGRTKASMFRVLP